MSRSSTNRTVHDSVYHRLRGSEFYKLLLAELKLERCELVGLPATSIKQQATESKGESSVLPTLVVWCTNLRTSIMEIQQK